MDTKEIIEVILRDQAFYGEIGGVTLSGGEPMMQPNAVLEILSAVKQKGISTAIETCGYFDAVHIPALAEVTDYFLWDFKDGNAARHEKYTGVNPEPIINNLLMVDQLAKQIILRCIIVKGVNIDSSHMDAIIELYHRLSHCTGIELIPYHAYGDSKYKNLGYFDNGNPNWIPSETDMEQIRLSLIDNGCNVY